MNKCGLGVPLLCLRLLFVDEAHKTSIQIIWVARLTHCMISRLQSLIVECVRNRNFGTSGLIVLLNQEKLYRFKCIKRAEQLSERNNITKFTGGFQNFDHVLSNIFWLLLSVCGVVY